MSDIWIGFIPVGRREWDSICAISTSSLVSNSISSVQFADFWKDLETRLNSSCIFSVFEHVCFSVQGCLVLLDTRPVFYSFLTLFFSFGMTGSGVNTDPTWVITSMKQTTSFWVLSILSTRSQSGSRRGTLNERYAPWLWKRPVVIRISDNEQNYKHSDWESVETKTITVSEKLTVVFRNRYKFVFWRSGFFFYILFSNPKEGG